MLQRMSARELAEWRAFFKLENQDMEKRQQETAAASGATQRARKQLRR